MTERELWDNDKLTAFFEWKEKCAYEKCRDESQAVLGKYGRWRYNKWIERLSADFCGLDKLEASDQEYAWLLVEQHAIHTIYVKNKELQGKRYKDGMFYKAKQSSSPVLKTINGYLKLMYRDIVRKNSLKKDNFNSLDEELSLGSNSTRYDLIQDESIDPNCLVELTEIALKEIPDIFKGLEFREKVLILSKHDSINKPASDPVVLTVAGTAKSTMGDINKRLYTEQRHLSYLEDKFESEDQETISFLTKMIQDHLKTAAFYWAKSEIRCKPLLELASDNVLNFRSQS